MRYDHAGAWPYEVHETNGEKVTFSKLSAPDQVKMSVNGSFSGTPGPEDAGKTNECTVKVSDTDGPDTATFSLEVLGSDTVRDLLQSSSPYR